MELVVDGEAPPRTSVDGMDGQIEVIVCYRYSSINILLKSNYRSKEREEIMIYDDSGVDFITTISERERDQVGIGIGTVLEL